MELPKASQCLRAPTHSTPPGFPALLGAPGSQPHGTGRAMGGAVVLGGVCGRDPGHTEWESGREKEALGSRGFWQFLMTLPCHCVSIQAGVICTLSTCLRVFATLYGIQSPKILLVPGEWE